MTDEATNELLREISRKLDRISRHLELITVIVAALLGAAMYLTHHTTG